MDDPTNPHLPRKKRRLSQTDAVAALAGLLAEGAPAATWRVSLHAGLDGQIFGETDTERRRALAEWQRVIGAGPVEVTPVGATEHLRVTGSYEEVPVVVTTIVAESRTCSSCGGVA